MLGYSVSELLERNVSELIHPDSPTAVAELVQDVVNGNLSSHTAEQLCRAAVPSA
jgi:hypothetical protein